MEWLRHGEFSMLVTLFGTRGPSLAPALTSGRSGNGGNCFALIGGGGYTVPAGAASGAHVVKASQVGGRVVAAAIFAVP